MRVFKEFAHLILTVSMVCLVFAAVSCGRQAPGRQVDLTAVCVDHRYLPECGGGK